MPLIQRYIPAANSLEDVNAQHYAIEGTCYPEDSEMARRVEWFTRGLWLERVTTDVQGVHGKGYECEWDGEHLKVQFEMGLKSAKLLPKEEFFNHPLTLHTDVNVDFIVEPEGKDGCEYTGYEEPEVIGIPSGFSITDCYTTDYRTSSERCYAVCMLPVRKTYNGVDFTYCTEWYLGDYSTHIAPKDDDDRYNAVRLDVAGMELICYTENTRGERYHFVKTEQPCTYDAFESRVQALRQACALLHGVWHNGPMFFFGYDAEEKDMQTMHVHCGWDTVCGGYTKMIDFGVGGKELLNQLSTALYHHPELYDVVVLLCQTTTERDFAKGCMASAMLERVTKIVSADAKPRPLIEDEETREDVIRTLKEALLLKQAEIGSEAYKTIKNKLGNIDRTNSVLLTEPFERLGIELTASDKKCIDCRNKFLHGVSVTEKNSKVPDFAGQPQEQYMQSVATRIHELTVRLLVRWLVKDGTKVWQRGSCIMS